jgi:predicted phosphoribosyltransferase
MQQTRNSEEQTSVFDNRRAAGVALARRLKRYANRPDVIVLALARGGVPVGYEVAHALSAPLDVVSVRKLGVPGREELAMGAIAPEGVWVENASVIRSHDISAAEFAGVAQRQQAELKRREQMYRGKAPYPGLRGKTVLLVDDGLATGATMKAAVAWVKKGGPKRIIVAVPVASRETCREFSRIADHIICVCATLPAELWAVGAWYRDFSQVTDHEVCEYLKKRAEELTSVPYTTCAR